MYVAARGAGLQGQTSQPTLPLVIPLPAHPYPVDPHHLPGPLPVPSANMPPAGAMHRPPYIGPGGLQYVSSVQDQNVAPAAAQANWQPEAGEAVRSQAPPQSKMPSLCQLVSRMEKYLNEDGERDIKLELDALAFLKSTLVALDRVKASDIQSNAYNGVHQFQQQATRASQQTNVAPQVQMQQPVPPQQNQAPALAKTNQTPISVPRLPVLPSNSTYSIAPQNQSWAPPAPTPQPEFEQGPSRQPIQQLEDQQPQPQIASKTRRALPKKAAKGKRKRNELTNDMEENAGQSAAKLQRPNFQWNAPAPPIQQPGQVSMVLPQAALPAAMEARVDRPSSVESFSGPIIASDLDFIGRREMPTPTPDMPAMVSNGQHKSQNDGTASTSEVCTEDLPVIPSGPSPFVVTPSEAPPQPTLEMLFGATQKSSYYGVHDLLDKLIAGKFTIAMGGDVLPLVTTSAGESITSSDSTAASVATTESNVSASASEAVSSTAAGIEGAQSTEQGEGPLFVLSKPKANSYSTNVRFLLDNLVPFEDILNYFKDDNRLTNDFK